ncbi:MAG TPA: alpha/beta hydrolase fold domain-containing protein [Saprospiraceae bacterium]|nr:alpha/beta hydrolase fold domain-containing protein [Saprospiraceae bacterium]HQN56163.1 alpha/beta hydrolase fold domain-containing protein [Saprospiraceae bacterium]HQP76307.1 alpha/beta hydrolase fold domain-containing protein [Saprospiraceae bacterium]
MNCFRLILLCLLPVFAFSQPCSTGCDGKRYIEYVFPEYEITSMKYARPIPENFDLYLDVYQLKGDQLEKRPMILYVHGGGFVSGSKADMAGFCIDYVKRGFVTASIDYRLMFGIPDQAGFIRGVVKAMNDFKAAYRFFKVDASGANQFRIDTTKMMIGGYSAGAVTVLHSAYLDSGDYVPPIILNEINAQGGWKGNTGDTENLSHREDDILGVFNYAGATFTKELFDEGDPFLMSYHGDIDNTVPIDSADFFGFATAYGSRVLHPKCAEKGIPQTLEVVPGGGHTEIFTDPNLWPYLLEFVGKAKDIYYPRICGTPANTGTLADEIAATAFPNPSSSKIKITFDRNVDGVLIYDRYGRLMSKHTPSGHVIEVEKHELIPGIYFAIPVIDGRQYRAVKIEFY